VNTIVPEGSRIIGLDLAKRSFVGCILSGEGFVKKEVFQGKMTCDERGWELLKRRIRVGDLVLMEAGTSTFTLARYLQKHSEASKVVVLNPGTLRVIWMSQRKNDKSDAMKIACIARDMNQEAWPTVPIPTEQEQAERSIITSYQFFKREETQLINRLHGLYHSLGFPDISRRVLMEHPKDRRNLARHLLGPYPTALKEADLMMDQLDSTQAIVAKEVDSLREICLAHPRQALSWFSIPGIGLINAATLVAYIGDGSRFSNPHQLLNYAGLVPRQDQSGETDKHLGISHQGNRAIRRNIVQGGWVASTMKTVSPLTKYAYRKSKEGKPRQKIAVAVANKMLRIGFSLLRSGELYKPMVENGLFKLGEKLRSYRMQALMDHFPKA
jgi:transposase